MCGIAGFSLTERSAVSRTAAARVLLAGIAERGADAAGYAYRHDGPAARVYKQRSGASALLGQVVLPDTTRHVLMHVRDYTKGHPRIEANNHPIRHGAVVGVHNGLIVNDDEIFGSRGWDRAHPDMTVDSEAIFALIDDSPGPETLEELYGAMATAWIDERRPYERAAPPDAGLRALAGVRPAPVRPPPTGAPLFWRGDPLHRADAAPRPPPRVAGLPAQGAPHKPAPM